MFGLRDDVGARHRLALRQQVLALAGGDGHEILLVGQHQRPAEDGRLEAAADTGRAAGEVTAAVTRCTGKTCADLLV